MSFHWSYFVMVLCFSMTSSAVLDLHGNEFNRLSDQSSDVKQEEFLTPPTDSSSVNKNLNLFSNEALCRELCKKGDGGNACLCDWPPLKKQVFFALKKFHKERPLSFIKFPTPKDDPACRILCPNGEDGHFCIC